MTFQGPNREYCKHGGLSFIEVINKEYNEHGVICKNEFNTNPKRRFYSVKASLKIVLYWYQPYSSTTVTLSISNTSCDLLQLPTLLHCYECWVIQPLCSRLLRKITRHSSVLLHNQYRDILYTLPQGKCFVLQVFEKYGKYSLAGLSGFNHRCKIRISSNLIHEEDSTIHFFISGSIQPYFTQSVDETVMHKVKWITYYFTKNGIVDYMTLSGSVDVFCYPSPVIPSLFECDKKIGGSFFKNFFSSYQQLQLQNISVFGSFKTLENVFVFNIKSFISSDNWFEIILYKNFSTPVPLPSKPEYNNVILSSVSIKNLSRLSARRESVLILSIDKVALQKKEIVTIHSKIDADSSDDMKMKWQTNIRLTNYRQSSYISLPGNTMNVQLKVVKLEKNITLKFAWITNVYRKYWKNFLYKEKIFCPPRNFSKVMLNKLSWQHIKKAEMKGRDYRWFESVCNFLMTISLSNLFYVTGIFCLFMISKGNINY